MFLLCVVAVCCTIFYFLKRSKFEKEIVHEKYGRKIDADGEFEEISIVDFWIQMPKNLLPNWDSIRASYDFNFQQWEITHYPYADTECLILSCKFLKIKRAENAKDCNVLLRKRFVDLTADNVEEFKNLRY